MAHQLYGELEALHQHLRIPFQPPPLWNPCSLPNLEQLGKYPKYIYKEAKATSTRLSANVQEPELDKDKKEECTQIIDGIDESVGL
jgi:hypothetical protein